MLQIHGIPVARGSRHLPVAHKKDAPTPRKIFSQRPQQKDLDLADILYNVLCQDSKWMMKNQADTHPPPVDRNTLSPMLSSFDGYNDYLSVLEPLLLHELWTSISKEYDVFVCRILNPSPLPWHIQVQVVTTAAGRLK